MPAPTPAPPLVDAAAATPSLRTLGTASTQAAAGDDSRFGTPTAAQTTPAANKIPLAGVTGVIDAGWVHLAARLTVVSQALDLAASGVTANSYGSASAVSAITVDVYGRVTAAASTTIAIAAAAISDSTAAGRTLLTAADASAQRTALSLVIGTNVQAYNAVLSTVATIGADNTFLRVRSGALSYGSVLGTDVSGITATQVAYSSGTGLLGHSGLVYNSGTGTLTATRVNTGDINASGDLDVTLSATIHSSATVQGAFEADSLALFTPSATSSGAATKFALTPHADTGTTASSEAIDIDFDLSRTRTWATGAITTQKAMVVRAPTYAFVGASTITNTATVAITGAPIAGSNATLTNAYSLWVQAGATRLASLILDTALPITQGGTGQTSAAAAFAALITGTTISLAQGGTGQTTAVSALDALHGSIATIASATTTDLSTATGEYSIISGNVTITGFGTVAAGSSRIVRFSGTPIITHNATSLILPGGANITAASGDVMFISSLGSGNWRCTSYLRGAAVPYNADASALTTGALAIANGGTANTTANAALNALQALTLAQASTLALNDNITNTAPIVKVLKHTSTGTTAASFGLGWAADLQSAAGTLRRVMTDVTTLTTATDAAEVASRKIQLMNAGTLVDSLKLVTNSAGSLVAGSGTLNVTDTGSLAVLALASGSTAIGAIRARTSAVGMEYISVVGEHIFYTGTMAASGAAFTVNTSGVTVTPVATTSGVTNKFSVTPGADTGGTASTEAIDVNFNLSRTRTWATGAITTQRAMVVQAPTYAFVGASTVTSAATVAITGAPVAGSNATLTNAYALWVQAGTTLFSGQISAYGSGNTQMRMGVSAGQDYIIGRNSSTGELRIQGQQAGATGLYYGDTGGDFIQVDANGNWVIAPKITTSGVVTKWKIAPGADTGGTASTEAIDVDVDMSRTRTWATGAITTQKAMVVRAPTYAFVGASTITNTATLAITAAPIAGANATLTNAYSLWVQAGTVRFDLADSATNTAPDAIVQRHDTSGTAAAGFGITNAIELESAGGTMRRVMTDVTKLQVATNAAEEGRRTIALMANGTIADAFTFGITSTTAPTLFFGPAADQDYLRKSAIYTLQLAVQNRVTVTFLYDTTTLGNRLITAKGADVASATTLALGGDGNFFKITGTTTVKGILTTQWGAGSKLTLELASGITINHNDGSPGTDAQAIQLKANTNLVTSSVCILELISNGTYWYQVGYGT